MAVRIDQREMINQFQTSIETWADPVPSDDKARVNQNLLDCEAISKHAPYQFADNEISIQAMTELLAGQPISSTLSALKANWSGALETLDDGRKWLSLAQLRAPVFEHVYRLIGWWRGPNSAPAVKRSVRDFWFHCGTTGTEWLIGRLATETHIDILDGVANLLADIGPTSIDPILNKLKARPTRDQAEVLLKALGWVKAPRHAIELPAVDVEKILQAYLEHQDSDIRSSACAATSILPSDSAIALLRRRRG
jgi:hypothetical protein